MIKLSASLFIILFLKVTPIKIERGSKDVILGEKKCHISAALWHKNCCYCGGYQRSIFMSRDDTTFECIDETKNGKKIT